jgi:hypothetical protein
MRRCIHCVCAECLMGADARPMRNRQSELGRLFSLIFITNCICEKNFRYDMTNKYQRA